VADPRPKAPFITPSGHASRIRGAARRRHPAAARASVADPRIGDSSYNITKYQVTPYDGASRAVIGASTAGDGAYAVADPRPPTRPEAAPTTTASWSGEPRARHGSAHGWDNGRFSVADPRPQGLIGKDVNTYAQPGALRRGRLGADTGSVTAYGQADNGRWSIADRRVDLLPGLAEQLVCVIIARDGTWHRPFTTLELAALQSSTTPRTYLGARRPQRQRLARADRQRRALGRREGHGQRLRRLPAARVGRRELQAQPATASGSGSCRSRCRSTSADRCQRDHAGAPRRVWQHSPWYRFSLCVARSRRAARRWRVRPASSTLPRCAHRSLRRPRRAVRRRAGSRPYLPTHRVRWP
jgi:hypothetical protein